MSKLFTRRHLFQAGIGAWALHAAARRAAANAPGQLPAPLIPYDVRPKVALMKGEDRRKNIYNALMAIDKDIAPQIKKKKYVVIKPNNVSTVRQLAATHVDALRGALDYLSERHKGPVVIAESSAGDTMTGYENFKYTQLTSEYKNVKLVDLNEEAKYEIIPVLDADLHLAPVRLAARLLDPEAFILCSAILKTHNTVVATLSIKNMTLGAPLHQAPKETKRWNDKRQYHGGVRQTQYDMFLTAQKMKPFWGATVIDGFEGMEGNGPGSGTPVNHRIAIASADYVAADRIAVDAMGVDPAWMGYLLYCWQAGLGQYDAGKIDIAGESVASVVRKYQLHNDIERQIQWMGPLTDIPPKLG